MLKRILCALLPVLLCLSVCSCKKQSDKPRADTDTSSDALRIGVLLPDGGNVGPTRFILQGVQSAAEARKLPAPLCYFGVTDVRFDKSVPIQPEETEAETAQTTTPEPESFTRADGEVIVRGVPIEQNTPASAVRAVAEMLGAACSVIVAADPVYDDLTAFLAEQHPEITVLQYRGTHTDCANLQSFTDNAAEAFYLAGAAAGGEGVKRIGFTARTGSSDEQKCINAFARGVETVNKDARVFVHFTGVNMDLSLERSVPLDLIQNDKCGLLAQSVYTALPLSVAAEQKKPLPCIGCGYDMQADGGKGYLCSVVFDFSVYFDSVFASLADGTFDASPYSGGVREGVVTLSEIQNASEKTVKTVQTETEKITDGSFDVFEGFTPAENGFAPNILIR